MEKRSKVVRTTGNGSFTTQHGELYKHEIEFENGDIGQYNSKKVDQDKFVPGQEASYTIEQPANPEWDAKIKPVYEQRQGGGGGNYSGGKQKGNNRSFALSYAKDCWIGGKVDDSNKMFLLADKMAAWLDEKVWKIPNDDVKPTQAPEMMGNTPHPETGHEMAPITAITDEEDDLPF